MPHYQPVTSTNTGMRAHPPPPYHNVDRPPVSGPIRTGASQPADESTALLGTPQNYATVLVPVPAPEIKRFSFKDMILISIVVFMMGYYAYEPMNKGRRMEEKEKQMEGVSWANLKPSTHCLTYGTREYTATLINVPLGLNAIKECMRKPVEIHGKKWLPTRCEDDGVCGRVTGHWTVNANEGGCRPFWSYFRDKGCVQRGLRRYESPLENYNDDIYWQEMCSTTPAIIDGVHYNGPSSCADLGKDGKWGIWFISDAKCL